MFTKGISFKNFLIKRKKLLVKKNLKLILNENNQVICSLSKFYKDSFSRKNIKHFNKKLDYRIIGMGGALDSARFKYRLAEALEAPISDVDGMVIGGHSDKGMVPLTRLATRNSVPASEFLSEDRLNQVMEDTKVGGATLTKLLGTSAWYAPGAAVSGLVQAIACDQKKIFPCSVLLDGEYGLSDLCIGVPVVLGANGIEKIVEIELSDAEKEHLHNSAEGVKTTNGLL